MPSVIHCTAPYVFMNPSSKFRTIVSIANESPILKVAGITEMWQRSSVVIHWDIQIINSRHTLLTSQQYTGENTVEITTELVAQTSKFNFWEIQ